MHAFTSILLAIFVLSAQAGDEEIFKRANTLWDQGQQVEALKACKELIKNYPTSKHVPEAYLMFGEFYFDQAKLNKALMAYKKVAEFRNSKVYTYAIYKTGWCYYNLQEFKRALAQFAEVVKHCDKQESAAGKKSKLRTEALNDIVLVFSHTKEAKSAPAFFKRLAPQESRLLLEKLAGMYYGQAKLDNAVFLYQHLLSKEQCSPKELVYQKKIVDCTVQTGNKIKIIQEAGRLVVLFGQIEKCLLKPATRQLKTLQQVKKETEQALYTLAVSFRKEAKATKDPETFRHASKVAEFYLELFSENPRANEIRSLLH
jgi:tetratricopeptide (TPR) repeat protein